MSAAEKQGRGCFFYGCLTAVLLVLVGAFSLYYGTKYAIGKFIEAYTEDTARDLPTVDIAEEELSELRQRVESFRRAIADEESAPPLELTAEELNALIVHDSELQKLRGKVYLDIEGDQLKGEVSIPLDDLNFDMVQGRYLNGSGVFDVSVDEDGLSVKIRALEINGDPLPEKFIADIRGQNILEDADLGYETERMIRQLKSLEVRDGKVVLELKSTTPAEVIDPAEFNIQ